MANLLPSESLSEASFGFVEFIKDKEERDKAHTDFNGRTIENFKWVTFTTRDKIKKLILHSLTNSATPVVGADFLHF